MRACNIITRQSLLRLLPVLVIMLISPIAFAIDWPQEITTPKGTIVIYQPQPESLKGNILAGRAAISYQPESGDQIFGAFWFTAKLDTDTDSNTALIRDVSVTETRWPDATDEYKQRFTEIVEKAVPEHGFEISMERLSASLESANIEKESLDNLRNDPPHILFKEKIAVLLLYDGDPFFVPIDNSPYQHALNTPFAVVKDTGDNDVYLGSGAYWYTSKNPLGPWTSIDKPPADLVALVKTTENADDNQNTNSSDDTALITGSGDSALPIDSTSSVGPPEIIVATEPSELIISDGAPRWKSLAGGELLYVENTETPWIRELSSGYMYVLLSGRWFKARDTNGPWTFVRADKLPKSFSEIPPASEIGGVRTSVAGTSEATDALYDAEIPQTAAIKRDDATVDVTYDGEPKFEKISGTKVSYAVNTGSQVLLIDNHYYVLDDGVWFTSTAAKGPFVVADSIPADEIEKIPPSSPVYNTRYVTIYESTPEIVYVGYTPGYLWSYPYYGVPIYGTGWYYPPYVGHWYYPRTPTFGFHVGYNSWTGWNFGIGVSNGFFSFGINFGGGWGHHGGWGCCGGWHGGGYRGPTFVNNGNINIGNNINFGNRTEINNRLSKIDRTGNISRFDARSRTNLYNRASNRSRITDSSTLSEKVNRARSSTTHQNNVFTDSDGNVARRVPEGWQQRANGKWSNTLPSDIGANVPSDLRAEVPSEISARIPSNTREQTSARLNQELNSGGSISRPTSMPDFDRGSLNRAHAARQHGGARQRTRPAGFGGGHHRR
ncbi:MAG: hypothetical protein DHS20C01_25720 [marine bacterium B5-7]|nr:MAG: hypothetical protein DHS20C01_25720 [marine bacterium B5-7]